MIHRPFWGSQDRGEVNSGPVICLELDPGFCDQGDMKLGDLVRQARSIRRFKPVAITRQTLLDLVALARLSASAANLQPLRYVLSCDPDTNARVFPCTRWAGRLKDWPGPAEHERPSAYIVITLDSSLAKQAGPDVGIAAQSIVLGAAERGLAACMLGALDRPALALALRIPPQYPIELVIALGAPGETVVLEEAARGGDIGYYRDEQGIHHVPKRRLEDIVLNA